MYRSPAQKMADMADSIHSQIDDALEKARQAERRAQELVADLENAWGEAEDFEDQVETMIEEAVEEAVDEKMEDAVEEALAAQRDRVKYVVISVVSHECTGGCMTIYGPFSALEAQEVANETSGVIYRLHNAPEADENKGPQI